MLYFRGHASFTWWQDAWWEKPFTSFFPATLKGLSSLPFLTAAKSGRSFYQALQLPLCRVVLIGNTYFYVWVHVHMNMYRPEVSLGGLPQQSSPLLFWDRVFVVLEFINRPISLVSWIPRFTASTSSELGLPEHKYFILVFPNSAIPYEFMGANYIQTTPNI